MYTYNDGGAGALVALYLVLIPLLLIIALVGYIVGSFFLMKVFEKAGVQGKWRAWVPGTDGAEWKVGEEVALEFSPDRAWSFAPPGAPPGPAS